MKILVIGKGKMGNILKDIYPNEVIEEIDTIEEIKKYMKLSLKKMKENV